MSHYHFEIKSGTRGSAAEHVAYITRRGRHSDRGDLIATEHGNMPEWAEHDPELFWKASERFERKNASPYRDITIALPSALIPEQNVELARDLIKVVAKSKPFQAAVHLSTTSLERKSNPHLHVMISDRLPDGIERAPEKTFRRHDAIHPERGGRKKDSGGLNRMQLRDHVLAQRKIVADTINVALEKHGHDLRVDHRSLRERGKSREPERYLGPARIRTMSDIQKKQYVSERLRERRADRKRTDT